METLVNLTNPEFTIKFMGKDYVVRKANLGKVVQYMQRAEELKSSGGTMMENGSKIVAYALWLILSSVDSVITEQEVYDNLPGDIEASDLLVQLGFINPKRSAMSIAEAAKVPPTTEQSSSTLQKEPDGVPEK